MRSLRTVPSSNRAGNLARSSAGCLLVALLVALPSRGADTLLSFGSHWLYFDFGAEPDALWFSPFYDDGDWNIGLAELGYGDGDETTVVNYGPDDENKYVTTYFRKLVQVTDPSDYSSFTLNLKRDDGAVIYVNGVEVHRSNMPGGTVGYWTFAVSRLTAPVEDDMDVVFLPASAFVAGANLIAVEVHQSELSSPDLSFDLEMIGNLPGGGSIVTRGPYLQIGASSNIVVRWRTSEPRDAVVWFGTAPASLTFVASNAAFGTDHEVALSGLAPDTKYFYAIGSSAGVLEGDAGYFFVTAPVPGTVRPTRIWAIGDFGTGYAAQYAVRNAYTNFTGSRYTDVWLMLGDNAYGQGFDHEYQSYVFDIYPRLLRQTVTWPTMGNHETGFGSEALTDNYDYYRIFTLPTNGQAGGVASGTEHYYSFDHGNIHFVCLDSQTAAFRQPNSAMANWLRADLADNMRDWIIAYFHHPPYSRGSHYSDFDYPLDEMRENIVPILESFGVDLVLAGHSHSYERSYLLDGHYGNSWTIDATNFLNTGSGRTNDTGAYLKPAGGLGERRGTVYIVDGSSGGQFGGGELNHPVMYFGTLDPCSLVIDIDGLRLDATTIRHDGAILDHFTIDKRWTTNPAPALKLTRAGTNAVLTWPTTAPDYQVQGRASINEPWAGSALNTVTNGRWKSATVPTAPGNQFFRLRSGP
jgi:hypothetical protein